MERFASGWKRNYYGKGNVIVYRLNRDGAVPDNQNPVFGANVMMLIYGDAFWPTYTAGDNTGLIATDSMKNFIQRETLSYSGADLEDYCRFLAAKFLHVYPHVEGVQVSVTEIPYAPFSDGSKAFAPSGPERLSARIELNRAGMVEIASGIRGFRMLRLGGSAFQGFVRDQYTTLPDIHNRPLHMWLDVEWLYTNPDSGFSAGRIPCATRRILRQVFESFESGSIQEIIYQAGKKMLYEIPEIAEIHLEANNRTWDTVVERGEELGVYTDARPPYGCLGLRLRRQYSEYWMAHLSTHVLDTMRGVPAEGVTIDLYRVEENGRQLIKRERTNSDGRTSEPLLSDENMQAGVYELRFHAGEYFHRLGVSLASPPFLDEIVIRFGLADPKGSYHVPLLLSPYGYSTYRGS